MSKCRELLEAMHYKTKVKQIETNGGSRHIRNMVEQSIKRCLEMLDPKHPSPCPYDQKDKFLMERAIELLSQTAASLKQVKEKRNGKNR